MAPRPTTTKRIFAATAAAARIQIRSYSAPAERSIPAAKQKYVPTSGTYPKGFLAGSAFAGVKASNTKYDDLALIVSEKPCAGSAVFTRNIFRAAPCKVSQDILRSQGYKNLRGVVVNSGCANAVTGKRGQEHAQLMSRTTDRMFGAPEDAPPETLVMSTGVIGQRLPIDRITDAIPRLHASLGSTHEHWLGAAHAICTTDTFPKLISKTFTLPSHPETTYSIAGMTKGAGMIHPNMATLLATVCTDVSVSPDAIAALLRHHTQASFNSISVDGDTSTNDTLAFFANGAASPPGIEPLNYGRNAAKSPDLLAFERVFSTFLQDLAKLVVRDGEGATKFVTIRVRSDVGYKTAKRAAVSIARSALVKTALYGKDANWGRILCAIGYAPGIMSSFELDAKALVHGETARYVKKKKNNNNNNSDETSKVERDDYSAAAQYQVVPQRTSVSFIPSDGSEELKLLVRGEPEAVDEVRAKEILEMEDLEILVRLEDRSPQQDDGSLSSTTRGKVKEAVFWTCDFSHEYVTINGDYRT